MAAAMNHTIQTAQHLCVMTQTQMIDEDKVDPFPARTTAELEEMLNACRRTKEILTRESFVYSKSADFTKYTDQELLAMNAFVKESSRMLSIILAGGCSHFWTDGKVMSTLTELKNLYHYIDDKVKDFLMLDKIMDTLESKVRYGGELSRSKTIVLSGHPELSSFIPLDATKGPTSQESLERLASILENFSKQCRTIAVIRGAKFEDRGKKVSVREKLLAEIETVMPFLRQHVLRMGLAKSLLKEDVKTKAGNPAQQSDARKITALFTFTAVEEAHRTVEDCRERLVQEMLFRRAKVERRLEKEEEREKQGMRFATSEELTGMPAYSGVMADQNTQRRSESPQSPGRQSPRTSAPISPSPEDASPKSRTRPKSQRAESPPSKTTSRGAPKSDPGKAGYPDKRSAKASPTKGRQASPPKAASPNAASPKGRSRRG